MSPIPIEAYSFASRFELARVREWLAAGAPARLGKTLLVFDCVHPDRELDPRETAELGGRSRVFAFDFGVLVFVDVPREQIDRLISTIGERLLREPHPPLREAFSLVVDPQKRTPSVTFDAVTVPTLSEAELECIATVLAQSVAIDYYEEDLRPILRRVGAIAEEISRAGKLTSARKSLIQFVATSISWQVEMIDSLSLLDKPDFTWEDEAAEKLYDILRHHFEIQERYRALEVKLETIRESLSQFLEINNAKRAFVLETLVVLLILFEIVLTLTERFGH